MNGGFGCVKWRSNENSQKVLHQPDMVKMGTCPHLTVQRYAPVNKTYFLEEENRVN